MKKSLLLFTSVILLLLSINRCVDDEPGVTDIDGNTYPTVVIGPQEWMAEDLRVTHYPNGDAIPNITKNITWGKLADNNTDDAYSFYNNDNTTDGALYTYAAAIADNWTRDINANQGVCPDGWHLPTDKEWTTLYDYLGGESVAGGKMKETDTIHWNSPNAGAINSSGFTALSSGYRLNHFGTFYGAGYYGYWWSATEGGSSRANNRGLCYYYANAYRFNYKKSHGLCVRCIKD